MNVVIKGDVHGSVEIILNVLETYDGNEHCRLDVVHIGVGDIIQGDLELALLFKAVVLAFSVNVLDKVKDVEFRPVNIIYWLGTI